MLEGWGKMWVDGCECVEWVRMGGWVIKEYKQQVTLVYGLAQLFLVEQLFPDLEQIM